MGEGHIDCSLYLMVEIFHKKIPKLKKNLQHVLYLSMSLSYLSDPLIYLCTPTPLYPSATLQHYTPLHPYTLLPPGLTQIYLWVENFPITLLKTASLQVYPIPIYCLFFFFHTAQHVGS